MARAFARPSRPGGLACWLVLLSLLVARTARADPFDPAGEDWEGYADFVSLARATLGDAFVVVPSVSFADLRAEDALILVHPERRLDTDSLSGFLSAGGRVVLLDDFGTGDGLLRRFGIQRVPLPARPADALRQNPELAIAVPAREHALVRGVDRVVTNHASGVLDPSLTALLEVESKKGDPTVVAMIGVVSRGAFVVVGDPSLFINSMLRYPGNKRLGENLVTWAARTQDGSRSGTVYFARGSFSQTGSFEAPPMAGDTSGMSRFRASEIVGAFLGLGSLGARGAHLLAALVGLFVVVWIGSRAGRTYRIVKPRLMRPVPLHAQGGTAGRAAALYARKSSRELALLELGKALEEDLTLALGLDRVINHEALLHKLARSSGVRGGLLDPESLAALAELWSRTAHIDTLMSAGRPEGLRRVRDAEVLAAAKVVRNVLARAHAKLQGEQAA
jgi:hypothetical protein